MLTRVTITGADDMVEPHALTALAEEYPFVEWGILYSKKRAGTPRYPSEAWISRLPKRGPFALHLCGEAARLTLDNCADVLEGRYPRFQRVQVNGYTPPSPDLVAVARALRGFEFILQVREDLQIQQAADDVFRIGRASIQRAILAVDTGPSAHRARCAG